MKNLLIYISNTLPKTETQLHLPYETKKLLKVQIDNSLSLGWKKEDILLVTNFKYEYKGLNAIVFEDVEYFERKPQASKINAILKLFDAGIIQKNELYWFHDLDAYQLVQFTSEEIGISDDEIALTDYGVTKHWSTGVIFFKAGSRDIFEHIKHITYKYNINEELALEILLKKHKDKIKRLKKLNKSYNFTPPNVRYIGTKVPLPLKVAHFHIVGGTGRFEVEHPVAFFKGQNEKKIPLINKQLITIFDMHGIS
jgi:hypothetical protein